MVQGTVSVEQVRQRQLQRYLSDGLGQVEGWLDPRSAKVIAALGEYQTAQGIRGAVGEIGVHHGKLLVLLDLIKAKGEISFAVDLFDDQQLNVDQSGWEIVPNWRESRKILRTGAGSVQISNENRSTARDDLLGSLRPVRFVFGSDGVILQPAP